MKNHIHNLAKYTALILISALPLSIEAAADPNQTVKPAGIASNFDGEATEPPSVEEKEE
ncbi:MULTISPECIES: hypothetical protein [Methylomonas]|uniref:hypothetical protein n=1 Tax=Methylomonas TaxID=416 RepID=UPI000B299BE4|nr:MULTISPECIES: hypothetical protein [Methylomonas]BBL57974.1 hypothetical protein MKFW12EY_15870 [Methylomonas koyamae]